MANSDSKVWLITGSSSGFGRSLTEAVLKNGDRVVATARKLEQLDDLFKHYPDTIKTVRFAEATFDHQRRCTDTH